MPAAKARKDSVSCGSGCVCSSQGLSLQGQTVKPYPRIETGGHAAKVNRIDVDAAQRFLVSASDDKTARVWDLNSGKLLKILRPPIGDGHEGMLYAVAVSPDGTSVAVGGFTGAAGLETTDLYLRSRERRDPPNHRAPSRGYISSCLFPGRPLSCRCSWPARTGSAYSKASVIPRSPAIWSTEMTAIGLNLTRRAGW